MFFEFLVEPNFGGPVLAKKMRLGPRTVDRDCSKQAQGKEKTVKILALRENGATIMFSTHNMESVEELCDDIALINDAEKILDGNVREIRKANKTNLFNIEFSGTIEAFSQSLNGNTLISHKVEGDSITAQVQLPKETPLNDLLSLIIPHVSLIACHETIPTMRDIFISSVKENKKLQ